MVYASDSRSSRGRGAAKKKGTTQLCFGSGNRDYQEWWLLTFAPKNAQASVRYGTSRPTTLHVWGPLPSEPEVDEIETSGVVAAAEGEVGWLDVAVDESFTVNVFDCV